MINTQQITDKFAIALSLACAFHCLAIPLLIVLLPSLSALNLENEVFHKWMVFTVLPTSIYALTVGCRQHQRYTLMPLGGLGLLLLIAALVLGEEFGAFYEKLLTLMGAVIIASSHYLNFSLCRQHQCQCTDSQAY